MKLIITGKILAIAIAILGVIHNIATFTPIIKGVLTILPPGEMKFMIYANLMCGSSFIISGILLLMFLNKLKNYPFLIAPIVFVGSFLLISGILLIGFSDHIFENPFACASVILNLGMFLVTANLFYKIKFPRESSKWYNCLG
jgi:hypothetical protein